MFGIIFNVLYGIFWKLTGRLDIVILCILCQIAGYLYEINLKLIKEEKD